MYTYKFWDTFQNGFVDRRNNLEKTVDTNADPITKLVDCLFAFHKDNNFQDGVHTILTKSSSVIDVFDNLLSTESEEHIVPIMYKNCSQNDDVYYTVRADNLLPNYAVTCAESIELVRTDGHPIDWDDIKKISFQNNGMCIDMRENDDMRIEHERMCKIAEDNKGEIKEEERERERERGGILSYFGFGSSSSSCSHPPDQKEKEEEDHRSRFNIGDWLCSKSEPFLKTHSSRWSADLEVKARACRNPLYQFVVRYRKCHINDEKEKEKGYVLGDNRVEFSSHNEAVNALMHVIEARLIQRIVQHQYYKMVTKSEYVKVKPFFNHMPLGLVANVPKNVTHWSLVMDGYIISEKKNIIDDNIPSAERGTLYFPLVNTLGRDHYDANDIAANITSSTDRSMYSRDILFSKESDALLFMNFSRLDGEQMLSLELEMDVKEDQEFESRFGNYISISAYTINAMIGSSVCFCS